MSEQNNESPESLKRPQFRLSTMMWLTALVGVCMALVTYIGAWAAMVVGLFVLMIGAHVVGNALGTKLRRSGDSLSGKESAPGPGSSALARPVSESFAPTTHLRDRKSLGLPVLIATGVGFLVCGLLASLLLPQVLDPKPTWEAVLAGAIACGVLGALVTFAGFSFLQVTIKALWQATSEPTAPRNRHHNST
jgi:lysylphosphatidylglycerol synthetase-like protein (DUF2156 family)